MVFLSVPTVIVPDVFYAEGKDVKERAGRTDTWTARKSVHRGGGKSDPETLRRQVPRARRKKTTTDAVKVRAAESQ